MLIENYSQEDDNTDKHDEKTPSDKKTLADLLELMRRAESEMDDFDIDLGELGSDIRGKIDNIVEYLDYCDEKAQSLRVKMKLFEKKAKAYENKSKSLRQYVANQLAFDADQKGAISADEAIMHRISGDTYQMSLQFHDFVEVNRDPDPVAFLKLGPSYIERRYCWNKRALKMALENQSRVVAEYAELRRRPHLKIELKH